MLWSTSMEIPVGRTEPAGGARVHQLRLRPRGAGGHRRVRQLRHPGGRREGDPPRARPCAGAQPAHLPERGVHRRTAPSSRCSTASRGAGDRGVRARRRRLSVRTLSIAALQTVAARGRSPRRHSSASPSKRRVRSGARSRMPAAAAAGAAPLRPARRCSTRAPATRPRSRCEIPGPLTAATRRDRGRDRPLARAGLGLRAGGRRAHLQHRARRSRPPGELVAAYRKAFPWQPHGDERTRRSVRHLRDPRPRAPRSGDLLRRLLSRSLPPARLDGRRGRPASDFDHDQRPRPPSWSPQERTRSSTSSTSSTSTLPPRPRSGAASSSIPRAWCAGRAGSGEEMVSDVLDLDAVTRVRQFGTAGVSRMWAQLDAGAAGGLELPMYAGGGIRPREASGG